MKFTIYIKFLVLVILPLRDHKNGIYSFSITNKWLGLKAKQRNKCVF